jgi:hypothetical protein
VNCACEAGGTAARAARPFAVRCSGVGCGAIVVLLGVTVMVKPP